MQRRSKLTSQQGPCAFLSFSKMFLFKEKLCLWSTRASRISLRTQGVRCNYSPVERKPVPVAHGRFNLSPDCTRKLGSDLIQSQSVKDAKPTKMLKFFRHMSWKPPNDTCANLHKINDQDRHKRIKRSPWFGSKEICTVMIREWHTWLDFSSVLRLIDMA